MASRRGRGSSGGCVTLVVKTGAVFLVAVWIVAALTGFAPGFPGSAFLPSIPAPTLSATDFDSPIPNKRPGELDSILPNARRSSKLRHKWAQNPLYTTLRVVSGQGGFAAAAIIPNEEFPVKLPVGRPKPAGWNQDPLDYPKPRTFFDVSIDGKAVGRIVFELYTKQSPLWAENFRALCTGEKGSVPNEDGREGAGLPYHFKGKPFYRVIDQFICQTGVGTESVYGEQFKDDVGGLLLKHNKVEGYDVVQKINALAKPKGVPDEWPRLPVIIEDSGQLDCTEDGTCKKIQF